MASNLLLPLILMASVITTAHSRIIIQLNNGFHPQLSFFNRHEVTLTQIEDSKNVNQGNHVAQEHSESNASIPTGVGDEVFTTESTLVSSFIQQYILKAAVVTIILVLISSVTGVVLRTICNCYRSVGTDEENGPRSTGTRSVGPQRPNGVENESIESVGPERATYEPRPIPENVVNYELTIFSCNFPLCGLPL